MCSIAGDVCQYDKNKITCKESFLGTDFTMTVKLEVCDEDVSATVSLKGAGVDYSHKFKSETDVPIPGMSAGPLGKVYLRVVLRRSWDEAVYIKVIFSNSKSQKLEKLNFNWYK